LERRPITQREFINYARGLGNYCTYGDAQAALEAVFKSFKQALGNGAGTLGDLLPESVKPVWDGAAPGGTPGSSIVDLVQAYGSLATRRDAEIALVTLFGTIKEKQSWLKQEWEKAIPAEVKTYWEKSRTIDEVQDAGQCL